jgi:hypothetical protein
LRAYFFCQIIEHTNEQTVKNITYPYYWLFFLCKIKLKLKGKEWGCVAKVLKEHQNAGHEEEPNLQGTFSAVMAIGIFIVITWIGAFSLFLSR